MQDEKSQFDLWVTLRLFVEVRAGCTALKSPWTFETRGGAMGSWEERGSIIE
jgi:hypothetical protein